MGCGVTEIINICDNSSLIPAWHNIASQQTEDIVLLHTGASKLPQRAYWDTRGMVLRVLFK
jgi:hypothetical protein